MSMLAKSIDRRPDDANAAHAVLLRHTTELDVLPEIHDVSGPALLDAKAVGAT
ncbi:hypothetical protein [Nocardia aurea]|uniref:Uncharacterized protein n=1 Tax=Nocardia aurea TaxID=2144174 RepID=A0ABV3FZ45_9NOCA